MKQTKHEYDRIDALQCETNQKQYIDNMTARWCFLQLSRDLHCDVARLLSEWVADVAMVTFKENGHHRQNKNSFCFLLIETCQNAIVIFKKYYLQRKKHIQNCIDDCIRWKGQWKKKKHKRLKCELFLFGQDKTVCTFLDIIILPSTKCQTDRQM